MNLDSTLVAAGIFILWQVAAIPLGLFKGRRTKIPRQSVILFLSCGSALALFRVWAFWYLSYREQSPAAH